MSPLLEFPSVLIFLVIHFIGAKLFKIIYGIILASLDALYNSIITAERCQVFPDLREERHRRLEFNTSAVNILNSLEYLGYRVITSGSFVASQANNKKV